MSVEKGRILVVDDEAFNIKVLADLLKNDYQVIVAKNGEQALKRAVSDSPPDLILLDVMMPAMDGYEVCQNLKGNAKTKHIPVIFLTAMGDPQGEELGLELGAVDYITKPYSPSIVKVRIHNHLELKRSRDLLERQNEILEEKVRERTQEVVLTQDVTILTLASLAETRDNETGNHIRRTQNYVQAIANKLSNHPRFEAELDSLTIELLLKSAPLHDIGKVGIPDSILLKPGKLGGDEFAIMKNHAVYGHDALVAAEDVLGSTSFLRFAKEIAVSHHEKWDGSGYPKGLSGDDIPLSGRLMAIADVYDALISKRVYKPAFPHEKAMSIIKEGSGSHFDPDIVEAFFQIENEVQMIAKSFADSD